MLVRTDKKWDYGIGMIKVGRPGAYRRYEKTH